MNHFDTEPQPRFSFPLLRLSALLHEDVRRSTLDRAVREVGDKLFLRPGSADLIRCQKIDPTPAHALPPLATTHHLGYHRRLLQEADVPLNIFSAGLADVIEIVLNQRLPFDVAPTTNVVSNRMRWTDDGLMAKLVGFSEPLIHMFNKTEECFAEQAADAAILTSLKQRPMSVLLGDSIGDATMCSGGPHPPSTTLRIGFLNDASKAPQVLGDYLEKFDIVIVGDTPMTPVNCLLGALVT